jgi:copper(I)-binding protein
LGACGEPQEVLQSNPWGVNGQTGEVLLRAVRVVAPTGPSYPSGANAELRLTLLNEAATPDALTGATSPVAADTQLLWDHNCDGNVDRVPEIPLPPAGPDPQTTTLPTAANVLEAYWVVLTDLNRDVLAGENVDVTFTFAQAPPVTLAVPIRPGPADTSAPTTVAPCVTSIGPPPPT